jgi:hypothetical protein
VKFLESRQPGKTEQPIAHVGHISGLVVDAGMHLGPIGRFATNDEMLFSDGAPPVTDLHFSTHLRVSPLIFLKRSAILAVAAMIRNFASPSLIIVVTPVMIMLSGDDGGGQPKCNGQEQPKNPEHY